MAEAVLENDYRRQLNSDRGRETVGELFKTFGDKATFKNRLGKEVASKIGRKYLPQEMTDELDNIDWSDRESIKHFAARFAGNHAKSKLFQRYIRDVAREAAKRAVLNRVKVAFAATLVGLIVTYLIMTVQMIAGNLLHSGWIPSLYLFERLLWWFLTILLFIILIITLVLLMLLLLTSLGPVAGLTYFGSELFNILKDYIF